MEWIQGRTRFLLCISNEPIKWMIRYSFVRIRPYIELGRRRPICDDPRTRNHLYALFLDVEFFLLDSELGNKSFSVLPPHRRRHPSREAPQALLGRDQRAPAQARGEFEDPRVQALKLEFPCFDGEDPDDWI